MSKKQEHRDHQHASRDIDLPGAAQEQRAWEQPKLTEFVKPKLTQHGPLERVTGGFFGEFSP